MLQLVRATFTRYPRPGSRVGPLTQFAGDAFVCSAAAQREHFVRKSSARWILRHCNSLHRRIRAAGHADAGPWPSGLKPPSRRPAGGDMARLQISFFNAPSIFANEWLTLPRLRDADFTCRYVMQSPRCFPPVSPQRVNGSSCRAAHPTARRALSKPIGRTSCQARLSLDQRAVDVGG